jgi:hypothetical protein
MRVYVGISFCAFIARVLNVHSPIVACIMTKHPQPQSSVLTSPSSRIYDFIAVVVSS